MISPAHMRLMAAYNEWQNRSLYDAAATLSDAERREGRGAFFGSIHGSLNHVLWGDRMWLSRFTPSEAPDAGIKESASLFEDWDILRAERDKTDAHILAWADAMTGAEIEGGLTWFSGAANREITLPRWVLITHFFNHQTHHRGQVHAMLTAAGAKPDDTDIPFMPNLDAVLNRG
ncbi:DinB family protein [Hyphococcus luteus]|uniref:Damage-inducible protein DinB n=1 Tax=Hyphococcus luteus TaxID=2058213 RepID=A0A2S7K7P9_9PROT|nr:DinB family protein [Marinicaulis flavus]PQA88512.1 damage-inducible protein DinB [Marinicaulis flavus]